MKEFRLDDRLAADTLPACELGLSRVLLMNDARFPWVILAPQRPGLTDLHDMAAEDRAVLIEEAAQTSAALTRLTGLKKTNVAALGNQVRQFHVHVIARSPVDAAWPGPVWGVGAPRPYTLEEGNAFARRLAGELGVR